MPGTRASARLRSGVQEAESPSKSTSRAQVAAARRRVTRQTSPKTAATETEPPSSLPKQLRVQSPSHRGSNIARRSARRPMDSRSVASIPTVLQESSERAQTTEGEDNGDGSEDEADEDAIVAQLEIHSSGSEEPPASDQHTPNADMMVKSRQYLYDAAQDMYEHLCLGDRDPTWDDLLWTLREVLNSWKIHYPTERTPFLGRDLIDHTLKDHRKQVPVSHIVSAANLVILLDFVHQVEAGEGAPLRLFEKIDEDFPRCIMASESATAKTNEKHETFKLALRVRVSLWALRILETEDCTPEVAMNYGARLMFGQPGDYTAFPAEEDIKDIKFRSIHGVEFDNPSDDKETGMRKDIWRDFDLVRQIILSDDGFDPEAIKQAFPIDVCLDKLSQWAKSCFNEIVKTIDGEDESPRSRTSRRQAKGIDGKTSKDSLYINKSAVHSLGKAATSSSSSKRRRDEDAGEGDAYDFPASPARKKPRSRAPRTRGAKDPEPTRAEDEDAEDAPRGTGEAAEHPPRFTESETPSHTQKQPQRKRVAWDKHDERVLVHWVKVHGSFWSHMERMAQGSEPCGEMLFEKRTQQQLRDKARNMKVDMLKNDMILPENFDHVWLGSKEANVLKNLGKNPGRLEADVEDGQPVNTEYIPPDGE